MKIIDSSVWIALFHENDSQNLKAKKLLGSLRLPVAVTEYIILETCTVLANKASKKVADRFLVEVLDNEDVRLLLSEKDYFWEVVSCFKEIPGSKFSFVDISLLCLSKKYEIITFDKKLNNELKKHA